jgi:hypothetical protein
MIAEVRFIEMCPHHALAVARLHEAARITGVGLAVHEVRASSVPEAKRPPCGGSPSIHIDGTDLFSGSAEPACRVYVTDSGLEGAPSVTQLVEALRRLLPPATSTRP